MLGASLGTGGQNGGLNPPVSSWRAALGATGFEAYVLRSTQVSPHRPDKHGTASVFIGRMTPPVGRAIAIILTQRA
jgi:hypothetical protein